MIQTVFELARRQPDDRRASIADRPRPKHGGHSPRDDYRRQNAVPSVGHDGGNRSQLS
jgi:hypothetical protein